MFDFLSELSHFVSPERSCALLRPCLGFSPRPEVCDCHPSARAASVTFGRHCWRGTHCTWHAAASSGRAGGIRVVTAQREQELPASPARNGGERPTERADTGSSDCFPQKPHGPLPRPLWWAGSCGRRQRVSPAASPAQKGLVCTVVVAPHPELPAAVQTCSADVVVCETTFALSINRKAALPPTARVRPREAIPVFLEERMPVPAPPRCPRSWCCLWSRVWQGWDELAPFVAHCLWLRSSALLEWRKRLP